MDVSPVWIVHSPHNRTAVEAVWAQGHRDHCTQGVTIFNGRGSPEESCAVTIAEVWLHHGPYSCHPPLSRLEVIGARVTDSVQAELASIGFAVLAERQDGFTATPLSANAE